jgi:hypothetical protein
MDDAEAYTFLGSVVRSSCTRHDNQYAELPLQTIKKFMESIDNGTMTFARRGLRHAAARLCGCQAWAPRAPHRSGGRHRRDDDHVRRQVPNTTNSGHADDDVYFDEGKNPEG